jgi:uncharacterized protein (DUF58 family)
MGFGGTDGTKFDFARKLIASLAYLVVHQGDAAGLLCVGGKTVAEVPPKRNPAHLRTILQTLNDTKPNGETGLISALHDLAEKVRRRALVVIFSDLFCDLDPLLSCFQHLRFEKHDLTIFHALDRQEIDFSFERPVRFVDLESSFSLVTEPAMIRHEYLRQFQEFLAKVRAGCHEFKVDYRQALTEKNHEKVLADFLVERARYAAMATAH